MSPVMDLFITLLSLGSSGWKKLLDDRKDNAAWFQKELGAAVERQGLRMLSVPANKISFAIDLSPLAKSLESKGQGDVDHLTFLGSALFTRRVSGPRVVLCAQPEAPGAEAPGDGEASEAQASSLKVKSSRKRSTAFPSKVMEHTRTRIRAVT